MAKSKYESNVQPHLDKIVKWAEKGATTKDIAAKLKIAYSTFRRYLDLGDGGDERYLALSASFAQACEIPDDQVETSLHKRACGFEYEERTFETRWNNKTEKFEDVCTKRITKMVPPDPTSAMFWLANRRPGRWKYKPQEGNSDNEGGGVIEITPVNTEVTPDV